MEDCEIWVTEHAKEQISLKEQEKQEDFASLLIGVVL